MNYVQYSLKLSSFMCTYIPIRFAFFGFLYITRTRLYYPLNIMFLCYHYTITDSTIYWRFLIYFRYAAIRSGISSLVGARLAYLKFGNCLKQKLYIVQEEYWCIFIQPRLNFFLVLNFLISLNICEIMFFNPNFFFFIF